MTPEQQRQLDALRDRLGMRVDPNAGRTFNDRAHDAYHRHNGSSAPCDRCRPVVSPFVRNALAGTLPAKATY